MPKTAEELEMEREAIDRTIEAERSSEEEGQRSGSRPAPPLPETEERPGRAERE